jgi:hypothetical protein
LGYFHRHNFLLDKIKHAKKAIKNAKKAIREAEREFVGVCGDISSISLGTLMDLLQPTDEEVEVGGEEEEEEVDDEAIARRMAVQLANRECNVKGPWDKLSFINYLPLSVVNNPK